jgi:hypothetical protein
MIALTIIEVQREWERLGPKPDGNYWSNAGNGILRRMDDPSLWTIIAALVAGLFIREGIRCLRSDGLLPRPAWYVSALFYLLWIVLSASLAAGYLYVTKFKHEALFFSEKPISPQNPINDYTIVVIQFIEGIANLLVITLAPVFLPIGICALNTLIRDLRPRGFAAKDPRLTSCAGWLFSATFAGPACSAVALTLWKIVGMIWEKKPEWFSSGSNDVTAADQIALGIASVTVSAVPFLVLLSFVYFRLRREMEFTIQKFTLFIFLFFMILFAISSSVPLILFAASYRNADGGRVPAAPIATGS